jgi:hypothetical protein
MNRIVAILFIIATTFASDKSDAQNEAKNEIGGIKGWMKDFKTNMANPVTSDGVMTIRNGDKVDAKMTCAEETPLLEITVAKDAVGNLNVQIEVDMTPNGGKTQTKFLSGVSGLCDGVGYLVCNGDSETCKAHRFYITEDGDFAVDYSQTVETANCVCVNNRCGGTNKSETQLSASIGSTLFAVLSAYNPNILLSAIDERENAQGKATYYQSGGVCASIGTPPKNDSELLQSGDAKAAEELNDPTSAYSLIDNTYRKNAAELNDPDSETSVAASELSGRIDTGLATVQRTSDGITYTDHLKTESGEWSSYKGDAPLSLEESNQSKYCEVSFFETAEGSMMSFGDTTQNPEGTLQTKKRQIRECEEDRCPYVESVETLVHQCGEINDLGETLSTLVAATGAARDMVCSSK